MASSEMVDVKALAELSRVLRSLERGLRELPDWYTQVRTALLEAEGVVRVQYRALEGVLARKIVSARAQAVDWFEPDPRFDRLWRRCGSQKALITHVGLLEAILPVPTMCGPSGQFVNLTLSIVVLTAEGKRLLVEVDRLAGREVQVMTVQSR